MEANVCFASQRQAAPAQSSHGYIHVAYNLLSPAVGAGRSPEAWEVFVELRGRAHAAAYQLYRSDCGWCLVGSRPHGDNAWSICGDTAVTSCHFERRPSHAKFLPQQ